MMVSDALANVSPIGVREQRGTPVVQIRGSGVLIYEEPFFRSAKKSARRTLAMMRNREKAYSGGTTQSMRKGLARSITILSQGIRGKWITNPATGRMQFHKLSFVTLTIPDDNPLTAREGYDLLLSRFLDWLTRTAAQECPLLKTYLWKAEFQTRGQLHYHITTPGFIHWEVIRNTWNRILHEAGLSDKYAAQHGHFNPNSTDIHDTRNVRQMDKYLIKELNKSIDAAVNEEVREIRAKEKAGELTRAEAKTMIDQARAKEFKTQGKVWGCSENLQGVKYFALDVRRDHEDMMQRWCDEGKAERFIGERFCMVSIKWDAFVDPAELLNQEERRRFTEHLRRQLKFDAVGEGEIQEDCTNGLLDILRDYTQEEVYSCLN